MLLLFTLSLVSFVANAQRYENINDTIVELFNECKCVPYYMCDEENFIISEDALAGTKTNHTSLKRIRRLTCANSYTFCCKERSKITTVLPEAATAPPPFRRPPPPCGFSASSSRNIFERYPWIVEIQQRKRNKFSFKCTGTLIHPKVVLTGQHYVRSARLFDLKIITPNDTSQNERKVARLIKHPQYYSGGLFNDIALLILEEPYHDISPICLPKASEEEYYGKRCSAITYGGHSEIAKYGKPVDLPVATRTMCEDMLRKTRLGPQFSLHSTFLCAGGEVDKDTCLGDGGGPLMCPEENGRQVQIGIVSWGLECGQVDVPGIYTNIPALRSWIDAELTREGIFLTN